jgi:hypothetical protein
MSITHRTTNVIPASILLSLVVAVLDVTLSCPPVTAQCCADCNGDGVVSIDELVGAVRLALDGCPSTPTPRIVLTDVDLSSFAATLDARVTQGHISVTIETAADDTGGPLFKISNRQTLSTVSLVRNGDFLRWITADSSGPERDISVRVTTWQPGVHTIIANWGRGQTAIGVDSVQFGLTATDDIILDAGSDFLLGSPGTTGAVFHEVEFTSASN